MFNKLRKQRTDAKFHRIQRRIYDMGYSDPATMAKRRAAELLVQKEEMAVNAIRRATTPGEKLSAQLARLDQHLSNL